jgi:acetyltransferase-like isoleucine patch superfamily enzyme
MGFAAVPAAEFTNTNPAYRAYEIGDWTYGSPAVHSWGEGTKLKIGRFCSIASGVTILLGGNHRVDWATTYPFNVLFEDAKGFTGHPASRGDVVIGNDVWIGTNAFILSGVRIGDGAVIGACSVVSRDVEPYSIAAGNPAHHIRYRFEESIVERMLKIKWWDWPVEKIMEAMPLLLSTDIGAFTEKYGVE